MSNSQPERPTCATCPYWHRQFDDDTSGDCRKNPPSPSRHDQRTFAETHHSAWCGAHPQFPAWLAATRTRQ